MSAKLAPPPAFADRFANLPPAFETFAMLRAHPETQNLATEWTRVAVKDARHNPKEGWLYFWPHRPVAIVEAREAGEIITMQAKVEDNLYDLYAKRVVR